MRKLRNVSPFVCQLVVPLLAVMFLSACDTGQKGQVQQERPPAPVTVTVVEPEGVTYYGEYAGRVRGSREVEVRSRIAGIIKERNYTEGATVLEGRSLFLIDPEPYQLGVRAAEAELADADNFHAQALREWNRISMLFEKNAVSERDRDQADANRGSAEARLERARVALDDAQRNLRYTRVESPLSGVAGMESLAVGNLVSSGALLTTLLQVDPVHIHFSLPETDAALQRQHAMASSELEEIRIRLADGSYYEHSGTLSFSDTRVNPQTASVAMRATVTNPRARLLPGQFLRVRIALQDYADVYLIDPVAVSQGPTGPQVFIVNEENIARAQPVRLGPMIGDRQIILDGLNPGDPVVVNGHVALFDGGTVMVTNEIEGAQ